MFRWLCVVLMAMHLSACAHYISEDSLRLVNRAIPFKAVKENPENYIGSYLFVGGIIAKVTNSEAGGELEIVQLKIDGYGRPIDFRNSEGRFLAQAGYFVDPAIYKEGLSVSMVGQVKGKKVQPLDDVSYSYPVLAVRELYLWQPHELYSDHAPYSYYFPYDYPYRYGMCNFGFGPYPYSYYGWEAGGCFLYDRYPYFPPYFFDRHRYFKPKHKVPPPAPDKPRGKGTVLPPAGPDKPAGGGGKISPPGPSVKPPRDQSGVPRGGGGSDHGSRPGVRSGGPRKGDGSGHRDGRDRD